MADGDKLPGPDHVARYCRQSRFKGGEISDANFAPRPRDGGRLSTNWVECIHVPLNERNDAGAVARLRRRLRFDMRDYIAFVQVEEVRKIGAAGVILDVREQGGGCHAVIMNVAWATSSLEGEFEAQAALARLARKRSQPALA